MRLIDAESVMARIKSAFCDGCDHYEHIMCRSCRINDVLNIIDESPNATTARLLTLEEALDCEECFFESWNGAEFYAECVYSDSMNCADIYGPHRFDRDVPLELYGIGWRCWSSRPTKEQMEETKWGCDRRKNRWRRHHGETD